MAVGRTATSSTGGTTPSERDTLKEGLQGSVLSAQQAATPSLDEFTEQSPMVLKIQEQTDQMISTVNDAIGNVKAQAEESMIDTDALVSTYTQGFESTRNMLIDAANASARKASFELDAYLGSAGSDARSAVRRNMAESVTTQLMSATQQNIASLYSNYTENVIKTTLTGGQVNAEIQMNAASSIANLTSTAAQVMLGSNSAILNTYTSQISAASDLFKTQAGLLSDIYKMESAERQTKLSLGEWRWVKGPNHSIYNYDMERKFITP